MTAFTSNFDLYSDFSLFKYLSELNHQLIMSRMRPHSLVIHRFTPSSVRY